MPLDLLWQLVLVADVETHSSDQQGYFAVQLAALAALAALVVGTGAVRTVDRILVEKEVESREVDHPRTAALADKVAVLVVAQMAGRLTVGYTMVNTKALLVIDLATVADQAAENQIHSCFTLPLQANLTNLPCSSSKA